MPARHQPSHASRRRWSRRRAAVVGGVAIVVLSGGGAAYASTVGSSGDHLPLYTKAGRWDTPSISVPPTTTATAAGGPSTSTTVPGRRPAVAPVSSPAPAAPAPGATAPTPGTDTPPVTYTVKPGDTLSTIAAWFKLHGYQALYQANAGVIGGDPDLIHPGQTITIADGVMTTSG